MHMADDRFSLRLIRTAPCGGRTGGGVGWPAAPADTDEEEPAVARVDVRVDTSVSVAERPVIAAATNPVTAMAKLPARAAWIVVFEEAMMRPWERIRPARRETAPF